MDATRIAALKELIKNSEGLQRDKNEQSFWLKNVHTLSDEKLQQLEKILTAEAEKIKTIKEKEAQHLLEIDQKYLAALQDFQKKEIPRFRKFVETKSREKENPDELLKNL